MKAENIQKLFKKNMPLLQKNYHVVRIGVFGSIARGEENAANDIDVLVEFSEPITMFRFLELEDFLSALLGRKVDLVTKNALKPIIRDSILREVLYA